MENKRWVWCGLHRLKRKNGNQAVGVVWIAPPGKEKWKISGGCGVDCTARKGKMENRRWVWCGLHRPGRKKENQAVVK
ncbi:MAG: hypothetical protein E7285_06205 [Lachnospiraceae bacterium]|nr:hypothetical protein [Lachnospiraceae bacterium]